MTIRRHFEVFAVCSTLAMVAGCVPEGYGPTGTGGGGTAGMSPSGGTDVGGTGGAPAGGGGGTAATGGDAAGGGGGLASGGSGGEPDNIWAPDEVVTIAETAMVVSAGQTQTKCIYCPEDHPVPMAGGFHLTNSAVFVQSSYPENWEHPESWESKNDWQRAGWCGTVYNSHNTASGGWDLYLSCRDKSSIDPSALDIVKDEGNQIWAGQGWIVASDHCPADHPIPWAGGFRNNSDGPSSKIQLIGSTALSWDTSNWPDDPAGWRWHVRGFNGSPGAGDQSLTTMLVCGKTGHFEAQDDVKHYSTTNGGGMWADVACPEDHPIPLTGGARTTSTATFVTSSRPVDWEDPSSWGMAAAPKWRGNADNYDQVPQQVESIIVCREKRSEEMLP